MNYHTLVGVIRRDLLRASLGIVLVTWFLFIGHNSWAEASPTVTLKQTVHFAAADGSDVEVEAGTYQVDAADSHLSLSAEGRASLLLDAKPTTHSESIDVPLAVTVPGEDPDVIHLVLVLPNGQALDAPGSLSGTRSREIAMMLATTAQIQYAVVAQVANVKLSSVVIYEHPNFGGRSQALGIGNHRLSDFNDLASSMKVPTGLVALLYEHANEVGGYGIWVDLLEDRPDLSQVSFNDKLSFVRVFSSPNPQGYVWARTSVQNGQIVPGHWELPRISGTPINTVAVVNPPLKPQLPAVPPAPSASDFDLAYYHAPIHYQDTNSSNYRADYITRFDYDLNMIATDNWKHLEQFQQFPLAGSAYYSVVQTCTHWFIAYGFFHPRDWTNAYAAQEHENDMEGLLTIVRRDGTRYGRLEGMITVFHNDFYSYVPPGVPPGSALRNGHETIDGTLTMQAYDGSFHPLTNQEDKGHGIKAFPWAGNFLTGNGGDGIIYFPSRTNAGVPTSGNDRHVDYRLIDFFAPGGLWQRQLDEAPLSHRDQAETFAKWGTIKGDGRDDGCGSGIPICATDSPHPPWGWDDQDDGPTYVGEMALDPAHLTEHYFSNLGNFSKLYVRNRYASDLKARGYRHGNVPRGWSKEVKYSSGQTVTLDDRTERINLDELFTKLTTTCP